MTDKQQAAEAFGLSETDIKTILDKCLKPEEISGDTTVQHARIKELVRWFRRYIDGNANPKWFQSHAFELVYYIATTAGNRFIDIEEVKKKAYFEGVNITPAERALMERMNIISATPPQPPAGPIWVKASADVLPSTEKDTVIRYGDDKELIVGSARMVRHLIKKGYTGIEFLLETAPAQQLFTREQVEEILKSYARVGYPEGNDMIKGAEKSLCEWFNTNYPLK